MNAAAVGALLAHRPGTTWPLDARAEELLARAAAAPGPWRVAAADLATPEARRALRPVLACLARKSAQEAGTDPEPHGGTLAFVRDTPTGAVRITGTFDNDPDTPWLAFDAPAPCPHRPALPGRGAGPLLDALQPAAADFWIDDTGFALASDLARLDRVRAAGAAESAVLYCNRIVEAMARHAVGPAARDGPPSLAGLITDLEKYHRLPGPLKRLLHLLRTAGNDARHALQPVSGADADATFAVLLRWLQWAFCEAPHGPRLAALTVPNRPAEGLLPRGLLALLDDAAATGEEVLARLTAGHPDGAVLLTPLVAAAAAEALLGRGRTEPARAVLDAALRRFPRDRRLRQLMGLYWSRRGGDERSAEHLNRARRELEPLLPAGGAAAADEETFGILAGVYKRLAELDPGAAWMDKARRTYRAGWEFSGGSNHYLGINAATLALWAGDAGAAADLARPIRDTLAALEARLREAGHGPRPLTYWDQVTWAEAELLLGEWDRAGELYRDAFVRFAARAADIAVSAAQAWRLLAHLGAADRATAVLGPHAP